MVCIIRLTIGAVVLSSVFAPAFAQLGRLGEPIILQPDSALTIVRATLASEPVTAIAGDGTVTIRFLTRAETPPAALAIGVVLDDSELLSPRYCQRLVEKGPATTEHVISFPIGQIESVPCDADGFLRENQGGVVYCELQIYDPGQSAEISYPFRFAYRGRQLVPCVADGPRVDVVSSERLLISWSSDCPASGVLRYEVGGFYTATDPLPQAIAFPSAQTHSIELTGLSPGDFVRYRICFDAAGAGDGAEVCEGPFEFRLPASDEPFLFAVMGDSQPGRGPGSERSNAVNLATLRAFARDAYARGARFIVFTGDLSDGFSTDPNDLAIQWNTWKRGMETVGRRIPIYELMGNHDASIEAYVTDSDRVFFDRRGPGSSEAVFDAMFANPRNGPPAEHLNGPPYGSTVYSFRWDRCLFIALNSTYWYCSHPEDLGGNLLGYLMDGQLSWLDEQLREVSSDPDLDHVFVFVHVPPFPCAGHVDDGMWYLGGDPSANSRLDGSPLDRAYVVARRDQFWELLTRCGKVRSVFSGHEHNHSRMKIDATTPVYADGGTNGAFVHPIWQCVSGGCGARHYTQEDAPWSGALEDFGVHLNYTLVGVSGQQVARFVLGGGQHEIDGCYLWEGSEATGRPATLADWAMNCGGSGTGLSLERVWPRADKGTAAVLYRSVCQSSVRIAIQAADGKTIRTLFDGIATPGLHRLEWDGRDSAGRPVESGRYLCTLKDVRGREQSRRIEWVD